MHSLLFNSFSDAPPAWRDICGNDLAMDLKMLSVLQRTLADQCRCWGLMVFDASGMVIGCAALCAFRVKPLKILFCGLPVPAGATHLRIRDGFSAVSVMQEISRAMQLLAASIKCHLIVFKEFDEATIPTAAALPGLGYVRGMIPQRHEFQGGFADFAEYAEALKSRYRAQVRRSQRKLQSAGFEVVCGRGSAFLAQHFDDGVHALYMAVQRRAEYKLELFPASFFLEMAKELGDEALLTLIRRGGRVCAFTFAVTRGRKHYNMYSGLDYALNDEGDLYFNLFYNDMDQAFRAGATSVHMGQTSDAFKSRLGTRAQPLWFFARATSPAFNWLLRLISPAVFPKVAAVEPHHVFAQAA